MPWYTSLHSMCERFVDTSRSFQYNNIDREMILSHCMPQNVQNYHIFWYLKSEKCVFPSIFVSKSKMSKILQNFFKKNSDVSKCHDEYDSNGRASALYTLWDHSDTNTSIRKYYRPIVSHDIFKTITYFGVSNPKNVWFLASSYL